MTITPFEIYLLTRLDPLADSLIGLCFATGIGTIISGILFLTGGPYYNEEEENFRAKIGPWAVRGAITLAVLIGLTSLVPTTKEAVVMLVLPKIAANQQVQSLPNNILQLVNDWIKELEPTARKGSKENPL